MKIKLLKVTVIFLLAMAALTIISRSAYNMSVTRVETIKAVNETIIKQISASGTVEAKGETAVVTEGNLLVKSVLVTKGQAIEAGQVLYELDLSKLEEELQKKEREIQTANLQIQASRDAAEESRQTRRLMIDQAESDLNRAVSEGDETVQKAWDELEECQNLINQSEELTEEEVTELQNKASELQKSYDAAVKSREDNVYNAQKALDIASQPKSELNTEEQEELSKQTLLLEQQKLQALKDKNGQILAPVKGVVTNVTVTTGAKTTGLADILIADMSKGARLVIEFTEEDLKQIERGMKVSIADSKINDETKKKLTDLNIEAFIQENETMGKAVIELPADTLEFGSSVAIKVKISSNNYKLCIPHEALNQGGKGEYYVYTLEQEETVLGKEWKARRIDVQVVDQGEKLVAVEGIINEQELITTSSKEVIDGSRVKRKES